MTDPYRPTRIFKLLGSSCRWMMLLCLAEEPHCSQQLEQRLGHVQPMIQASLKQLLKAGLIEHALKRGPGRAGYYQLAHGTVVTDDAITFDIEGYSIAIGRGLKATEATETRRIR